MDRKTRTMIEKNAFIFIGFLAAAKMIQWTAPVFDKFLGISFMGVNIATVLGGVLAYLMVRYISHDI
jgi:hypothetical protein